MNPISVMLAAASTVPGLSAAAGLGGDRYRQAPLCRGQRGVCAAPAASKGPSRPSWRLSAAPKPQSLHVAGMGRLCAARRQRAGHAAALSEFEHMQPAVNWEVTLCSLCLCAAPGTSGSSSCRRPAANCVCNAASPTSPRHSGP